MSDNPLTPELRSLARACVQASARAYREATISSHLAHCLVVPYSQSTIADSRFGSATILACRGSEHAQDWLTDFRVRFTPWLYGRVHSGFYNSVLSIMDQIKKLDQRADPAPVIVTGHSKGAAEALIVARMLQMEGRRVQAVVTFGGPRVGDMAWRKAYNAALGEVTWRFVNREDLVPRLPGWVHGYRHVGQEVFVSSLGGVQVRPPLWYKALSDLGGTMRAWSQGHGVAQLSCHPVSQYVEAVGKL